MKLIILSISKPYHKKFLGNYIEKLRQKNIFTQLESKELFNQESEKINYVRFWIKYLILLLHQQKFSRILYASSLIDSFSLYLSLHYPALLHQPSFATLPGSRYSLWKPKLFHFYWGWPQIHNLEAYLHSNPTCIYQCQHASLPQPISLSLEVFYLVSMSHRNIY